MVLNPPLVMFLESKAAIALSYILSVIVKKKTQDVRCKSDKHVFLKAGLNNCHSCQRKDK